MIKLSIDVLQLDKARFKPLTRKNGAQALFCELVLIETPGGQYGDYMVKQDCTKEEREAKVQMPIIGNGKNVGAKNPAQARPAAARPAPPVDKPANDDSEIPF